MAAVRRRPRASLLGSPSSCAASQRSAPPHSIIVALPNAVCGAVARTDRRHSAGPRDTVASPLFCPRKGAKKSCVWSRTAAQ